MCAPFASMPKVYKAKHAMILQDLVNILNENNYAIRSQVVNYQGKVIGIIAESSMPTITSGFIPCYPSALLSGIDYTFMMEPSIWQSYNETIAFLKNRRLLKTMASRIPFSRPTAENGNCILPKTPWCITLQQTRFSSSHKLPWNNVRLYPLWHRWVLNRLNLTTPRRRSPKY